MYLKEIKMGKVRKPRVEPQRFRCDSVLGRHVKEVPSTLHDLVLRSTVLYDVDGCACSAPIKGVITSVYDAFFEYIVLNAFSAKAEHHEECIRCARISDFDTRKHTGKTFLELQTERAALSSTDGSDIKAANDRLRATRDALSAELLCIMYDASLLDSDWATAGENAMRVGLRLACRTTLQLVQLYIGVADRTNYEECVAALRASVDCSWLDDPYALFLHAFTENLKNVVRTT